MDLQLFTLPPLAQRKWLSEWLARPAPESARNLLSEVRTFKDAGFMAVEAIGWIAIYALARTPASVIDRWSAVIASVMRMPAVRERFISLGLEPTGTTLAELAAIMAADTARLAPIIKASRFIAD